MLMGDAQVYDTWAREIAAGDWLGKTTFYQAPLYPYFLGLFYAIAGHQLWAVRIAQLAIGATSCALLAGAGYRFFSPLVGVVTGVMLALYPSAIYFDGLIQKTVLDGFFMALLLFLLSRALDEPTRQSLWILIGLALACLALTRENALLLPVLIIVWLTVYFRDRLFRLRLECIGLLLLGMSLLLLPVAWRNHHVGGGFELTTSQLGTNLYIGNHPAATGSYVPLRIGHGNALYERREATELAEQASGMKLTPTQVSSFWTGKALNYIREQPGQWLKLMVRKFSLTWNAHEISDTDDQYFTARSSSLLRLLTAIFHFGVICPIAAVGIVFWPNRQRVWILYLLLAGYAVSVAIFYVFARYRYPLVPILLLFGAAGVVITVQRIRRSEYVQPGLAALVAIVTAVAVNRPTGLAVDESATTLYNLSVGRLKQGQLEDAAKYAQRALQIDPDHWGAHNTVGRVFAAQGNPEAAVEEFQTAIRSVPESAELHNNLGNALLTLHRLPEAAEQFRMAIRFDPGSASGHNGLGVTLAQQGSLEEANEEFQQALRINPDFADAKRNALLIKQMRENNH